ncbi:polysaccharide deacetylase family protein [Actinopolymorpha alba]|uniref:polysaccharide deacetylase family protein n=1 Tax=Actinopolymorpha alba TaxID=533267 RepID=UPI00037844CD|nr:polysaccharide deacetylase family protein [Actinopolymorpha alba]
MSPPNEGTPGTNPTSTVAPGDPTASNGASPAAKASPQAKVVYLTFDDGPSEKWTPQVLTILAKHKAKATFFQLGSESRRLPDLVRQVRAAGHTIGDHTDVHRNLTKLSSDRIREEIRRGPASRCLRPPYGAVNSRVRKVAAELKQQIVLWDGDTLDWRRPGASKITQRIVKHAQPGAIILMHDGGGNRSQTVAALDPALTKLAKKGYSFKALDC